MLVVAGFLLCHHVVHLLHLAAWPAITRAAVFHMYQCEGCLVLESSVRGMESQHEVALGAVLGKLVLWL